MNNRIEELADQATEDIMGVKILNKKKFAELIVKECARIANEKEEGFPQYEPDMSVHYYITKHFGFEEPKGWVCSKCGVDRTKDVCPKGHTAALTGDCPMVAEAQ